MRLSNEEIAGMSLERTETSCELAARYERVYVVGSLVSVGGLHVSHRFHHTVLQQDTVATETLASEGHRLTRKLGCVSLRS